MDTRVDTRGRRLKKGEHQLKDGRYVYRYTDEDGKRKYLYSWRLTTLDKTPDGKKETKCLRELELEVVSAKRHTSSMSVVEYAKEFLEARPDYALATRSRYEQCLKDYLELSALGSSRLIEVTKVDILELYRELSEERGLGVSTVRNVHSLLSSMFQFAIKDNLLRENPCKGCLADFKIKESTRKPLTREEQHGLLEFLKDGSNLFSRHYDIVAVFLGTGMRASEVCGLTWDEINLEEKYILLKHQVLLDTRAGKRRNYVAPLKNGVPRIIPLPDTLIDVFNRRRQSYSFEDSVTVDGVKNFVFLNRNGGLYNVHYLNGILRRIIADFNNRSPDFKLPSFSLHVFRHTYCTRLLELGVDLKVVQEIMGHKSASVTMGVYAHLDESRLDEEVRGTVEIDLG